MFYRKFYNAQIAKRIVQKCFCRKIFEYSQFIKTFPFCFRESCCKSVVDSCVRDDVVAGVDVLHACSGVNRQRGVMSVDVSVGV